MKYLMGENREAAHSPLVSLYYGTLIQTTIADSSFTRPLELVYLCSYPSTYTLVSYASPITGVCSLTTVVPHL